MLYGIFINMKKEKRKIIFNQDELNDIINLYTKEYKSTLDIANKYGVDQSVISNRLIKNNIKIPNGSGYSVKYWIERGMSKSAAIAHIKTLRPTNTDYWINKGHDGKSAKLMADAQTFKTELGCIFKYGTTEGKIIWDNRKDLRINNAKSGNTSVDFWIRKGYSNDEAKEELRKRQSTFNINICIEKHGELKGKVIWQERQNKWISSLYKNGKLKSGFSKISQDLFDEIIKYYSNIEELNYVMYANKGGEFVINSDNKYGFFRYDFTDTIKNKMIEYNGDMFHGNPQTYSENDTPNPFVKDKTAKEMWDRDKRKLEIANKNGFEILVIWDSEYRLNPTDIIKKCVEFLNLKYDK